MMDEIVEEIIAASQIVVRENGKKARVQAKADLDAHLRTLMNGPDSRDFEFICKDGVRLKACRMFFVGRSPVFDSMLTNGMLETKSSEISLLKIPAPALQAILEYLYTGNIVDYEPKDWETGLEIISAAHFFLLPNVDKIVEESLMRHIPSVGGDLQQAATMLSTALTFKCLSDDENAACLQLVKLLETNWMHSDHACHLSEEAVDFILRHTNPKLEATDHLEASLEEYFRFRAVLIWCIYNSRFASTEDVDKLFNVAIPLARESLYVKGSKDLSSMEVAWLPNYGESRAQDEILQSLRSPGALESAKRLLAHIEWIRVPPAIMVKIVEPLKLVTESCLLDTFRFHSLHRVTPPKLRWAHNKSHSVHSGGLVIQKNGDSIGSAICQLPNRTSDDRCIWRFIIEKAGFPCDVGFVCSEGQANPCRTWNFELDSIQDSEDPKVVVGMVLWRPSPAGSMHFVGVGKSRHNYIVTSAKTIEFQFYRSTQSCLVVVDGSQLGTVWTALPTTSVFPYASLGKSDGLSVKLEVVSGFEVF